MRLRRAALFLVSTSGAPTVTPDPDPDGVAVDPHTGKPRQNLHPAEITEFAAVAISGV